MCAVKVTDNVACVELRVRFRLEDVCGCVH